MMALPSSLREVLASCWRGLVHSTGATSFVSGLVFALGLGVSGMTQPQKVLAFLDVTGDWDPSLALVMAGAIAVHAPLRWLILRRPAPLLGGAFSVAQKATLDVRLFAGAALFGAGWGMAGFCPGPAVTSLASAEPQVLVFVGTMLAGMAAYTLMPVRAAAAKRPARSGPPPS
jgi:uncharacterized membrane protein YedE/YeeE